MTHLKRCQKEATRMISKLRKITLVVKTSQFSPKGWERAKAPLFCRQEQEDVMATSEIISGLKHRCKFDRKGNFLLVNYSDWCTYFLKEEISCQNLKYNTFSRSSCTQREIMASQRERLKRQKWDGDTGRSVSLKQPLMATSSTPIPGMTTVIWAIAQSSTTLSYGVPWFAICWIALKLF